MNRSEAIQHILDNSTLLNRFNSENSVLDFRIKDSSTEVFVLQRYNNGGFDVYHKTKETTIEGTIKEFDKL